MLQKNAKDKKYDLTTRNKLICHILKFMNIVKIIMEGYIEEKRSRGRRRHTYSQ